MSSAPLIVIAERSSNKRAAAGVVSVDGLTQTMSEANESEDDDVALAAIAAGRLEALEGLYQGMRVAVFAVSFAVVGDRSVAEDLVHDTFVRVCERADSYRPGSNARGWILGFARNLSIDVLRRRGREYPVEEIEQAAEDHGFGTLVWVGALMGLSPLEREIVVLHALGGLTHREIAAHLRLAQGTVRWKYRVALGHLAPSILEAKDV
jgi:RNA polymerase sigma factor (sigma-70 family)